MLEILTQPIPSGRSWRILWHPVSFTCTAHSSGEASVISADDRIADFRRVPAKDLSRIPETGARLRTEVAVDSMIPVLVVDVTDEEADKILATMDPPTGMAGADPDKLADLLGDLEVTSDAMRAMLDDLAQETSSCPTLRRVTCPECGHQFDPK